MRRREHAGFALLVRLDTRRSPATREPALVVFVPTAEPHVGRAATVAELAHRSPTTIVTPLLVTAPNGLIPDTNDIV